LLWTPRKPSLLAYVTKSSAIIRPPPVQERQVYRM
jgi:hypothetical protein